MSQPTHYRESSRRRASSNYFELDADRRRTKSGRKDRLSHRVMSLEAAETIPGDKFSTAPQNIVNSTAVLDDDEISIDYCCDFLYAKFGFQEGSVANQREHVLLLLANGKARHHPSQPSHHHITQLHAKLVSNYKSWCEFLKTNPIHYQGVISGNLRHPLHMEIMLFFLIWGESSNLRHMPECICYIFHQLMKHLNQDIQGQDGKKEGWFLENVVQPIWEECSNMKRRNHLNKPLEHVKVRNYDDINEYFWKPYCLKIEVTQVGHELAQKHGKTFYEHRSIFTLILNYYRIFQANILFLTILVVLAFAVSISPNGGRSGFSQFQALGKTIEPFEKRDLKIGFVVLPFVMSLLGICKCVLEFAHSFHIIFSSESSLTSSRSWPYTLALAARTLWHTGFMALFAFMIYIPLRDQSDTTLLQNAYAVMAVYIIPGVAILAAQTFYPNLIRKTFALKFVREGSSSYVGREMAPPWKYKVQYVLFWIVLWICKSVVSYTILVRPLMLPSLAVYEMRLTYQSSVASFHNILVLVSYWAPTVLIFNYDTQIYFTILQSIIGGYMGWRMKTGEIRGSKELTRAFRVAPQLFDQKIVTNLARSSDLAQSLNPKDSKTSVNAATYESQMMLRFVVVWNEIVNSFREGDLLDDKEAAILQYDIRSNGEVFEPVFLSAGKLGEAITKTIRNSKDGKSESQLQVSLVEGDCVSAIKSFFTACMYVMEALFGVEDGNVIDGLRMMEEVVENRASMRSFQFQELARLRLAALDILEEILDLPDPSTVSAHLPDTFIHTLGIIRNFVNKMEVLLNSLQAFSEAPELKGKFVNTKFCSSPNGYMYAAQGLVNLYRSDVAMGAATRACLLLSLDRSEAMPRCMEAQRRLGFFMRSLVMEIPQLNAIKEMRSFSVVTPFYAETVLFSLKELNDPLVNHPIFQKVEEGGKNLTILKYLNKIHPEEWENFLERVDVASAEEAQERYPQEIRLWASYRGQTLARTVQGMMLYEDAIKILHWLEIGSNSARTAEEKQTQLQDMVRLKFSYICACQVYGKHRRENKQQADDIDYLLQEYPNLRVAYVDTIESGENQYMYDTVLIKSEQNEIVEVYRYQLPGDPIIGEGKPENQNNAMQFTRGEFVQTIDMNQQHYFEECLKMPQLLRTAELHSSGKPVSIIGMREHIFTGNASSLAKFKTWQELVFVTLSQRVLADPLYVRMHYGHPDIFDKVLALTRGGVSKSSKGINLSEDVFAGFNATLRGGVVTHVEFMQCGKGRDVALSQISMFEGKLANGAGETSLAREAHRMGQFMDFFRLNSMYYSHTGFFFATWMTVVTTFVYMYCKVYIALVGVQDQIIYKMNETSILSQNERYGIPSRAYYDTNAIVNTQYYIQAGLFLSLPLVVVYFSEMGLYRGFFRLIEMVITGGPFFFIFQVGTTMHYFDNNLVHGEAQYKATGRGFKITRELFVLLYKAYASSHYRKAFELTGLCLIYLTYGDFNICGPPPTADGNSFSFDFCTTAQSFWVQTFAIWFIAITWFIAPYIFNTDGLDFQKTKADIQAWATWMYADEKYEDEDSTMNGGWIGWWKSELKLFHNSKPIARLTIVLRESRHFVLMWYVVTLKWNLLTIAYVLGAGVLSVLLLNVMCLLRLAFRRCRPIPRALIYVTTVCLAIAAYFAITKYLFSTDFQEAASLFYGYIAVLYGINEMARMYSFQSTSIANTTIFQELAFFFDFMICFIMIVPLFIMSGIPFLNIVQTRMMYNKGFSQIVSASSQYAFSLAAFLGVVGGSGCGWILYVMSVLESSPGFISYATNYDLLDNKAGDGTTTYYFYFAAVMAAVLGGFFNFFFGRRLTVVCGGMLSALAMVLISAVTTQGESLLFPGTALLGASIGILLPSIAIYIYEISTRELRAKSMLLLGTGFIIGTMLGSIFMSPEQEIGWIWQLFIANILLSVVTPVVFLFPESAYWIYMREGADSCERCLTVLRRKEGVQDELQLIREESTSANKSTGNIFKFGLGLCLMIVSSLANGALVIYLTTALATSGSSASNFTNCVILQLVGALLSFFVIDRVDLRRVLLGTLLPITFFVAMLGFNANTNTWTGDANNVFLQLVGCLLYFFLGLGTSTALWASAVGLFPTKQRALYTTFYFMIFFLIPIVALYIRSSPSLYRSAEYVYLYTLAGVCILSTIFLFVAGHLSNGLIGTRQEQEVEEAQVRRARASRQSSRLTPGGRMRHINRSRDKSYNSSGYQLYESPAAGGRLP
ncbi:unnamed protein product [Albugo candida]|uniref:1,3-beta-glucan synthase n=1 Tax=Albugo candida TaxID=65357 RepID=A0A024GJY3_9STRA|nr:unnamed protein product [Albugo candida]|eukprot:CCI46822.1 unnamed protein product [Albugo candida]